MISNLLSCNPFEVGLLVDLGS